ncbi:MAG: hypothetical protein ICV81_04515 [Flavisolibacter sp.]|nr:hypothetical protein [Flavisolibacter sp.]
MYILPVKIESIERRKRSTGLLHIVAGLFLIISIGNYSKYEQYQKLLPLLPLYTVAVLSLIYGLFRKKIDPEAVYIHWVRLLQFPAFIVMGFLLFPFSGISAFTLFLWAAVVLFLMTTEGKIFKIKGLKIAKEGIIIPSHLKDHLLPWTLIESIVIRPDFVTIFRTNKKFVQLEMVQDMDRNKIREIEVFSQQQIEAHKQTTISSS